MIKDRSKSGIIEDLGDVVRSISQMEGHIEYVRYMGEIQLSIPTGQDELSRQHIKVSAETFTEYIQQEKKRLEEREKELVKELKDKYKE